MDIKKYGLKTTKAREGIIDLLIKSEKPLDAIETLGLLENKGLSIDQATIYRSLGIFAKKGVIREVYFNDGVVRYELSAKPEHHHAVCMKCGKVEDILDCSVDKIEKQIAKKKGFSVVSHSLEFFGVCKNCKTKRS